MQTCTWLFTQSLFIAMVASLILHSRGSSITLNDHSDLNLPSVSWRQLYPPLPNYCFLSSLSLRDGPFFVSSQCVNWFDCFSVMIHLDG